MSHQSRAIHFLFVSNVQHPDKGQPLKLTTPFVASSSHILKNHMTQSDEALLIVRRLGAFCYLLRSVKCQRKRNYYFGHTSLDCSQYSWLVSSERTFKWSVFRGEPAERGPGKNKKPTGAESATSWHSAGGDFNQKQSAHDTKCI